MANTQTLPGLLIKAHSGFFTVRCDDGSTFVCKAAGRLTRGKHEEDALACGDRVSVEPVPSEGFANGRIVAREPRGMMLSRKDPVSALKAGRELRQVIVANVGLVVFIFSATQPEFHPRMLDRYLVGAESQGLPVLIVVTKIDLTGLPAARALFADYERIGYEVLYASAITGEGIEALRARLHGRVSVLTGKSGVGKSSVLNQLSPGLQQAVGDISSTWAKGKHTTVVPELFALDAESWIADTPGIRGYAIWDVDAERLDEGYREIARYIGKCNFNNCTHQLHEPGCAVRAAVASGAISRARYVSFLKLYEELAAQGKR